MNQAPKTAAETENPWKRFSELPKPNANALVLAGALYLLASATVALGFQYKGFAAIAWCLLLAGAFFLTRSARLGWGLTVTASVAAFVLSGLLPAAGAVVAALCVGTMSGALLQTCTRKAWLLVLLPVAAGGIAYALTNSWMPAVAALALLPAALLLSVATNMGEYRTTAICYAEGGFLLVAAGAILIWLWRSCGSLNPTAIRSLFEQLRVQLVEAQISFREEYISALQSSTIGTEQVQKAIEQFREMMSDEVLNETTSRLFGMLPAFLCIACAIPAFLSQRMLNDGYVSLGMRCVITPEAEFFTMSVPSAVLFIVSTLMTMLFPASLGIPVTVAVNLCLILLPGFLVLGVRTFVTRFARMPANMRGVFLIFIVFLLCCTSFGAFFVVSLYGAYGRIMTAVHHRLTQNNSSGGFNDPSNPSGPFLRKSCQPGALTDAD